MPVAEAQLPIRIGAALPRTGLYATLGQNQLRGYQLCVKHTNEKGGVLGRKLELVVYDDRSDPPRPSASTRNSSRRTKWNWYSARTAPLPAKPWPT